MISELCRQAGNRANGSVDMLAIDEVRESRQTWKGNVVGAVMEL